ncbi:cytochrome bd oxidase small subunit CydS [Oceanobacillus sp. CAU 1775]
MFNDFLIFVAPFLVIIAAFILSFWVAKNDDAVIDDTDK